MAIEYKSQGLAQFKEALEQYKVHALERFFTERANLLTRLTERFVALTPVWEGNTMVNWHWAIGAPNMTVDQEEGQEIAPGETNRMALGSEPRRAVNTAKVFESLAKIVLYQGFEDIYLSNPSEGAIPLEYGLWPGGKGQVSRSPKGMLRLALYEVNNGYL